MTVHRQRAQFLMDQKRYTLASGELRSHLALHPDDAVARALLARCLSREDKNQDAIREARAAIAADPSAAFAHCILAEILADSGKLRDAETQANEAVRIEPENASFFGVLAQIRLALSDARGALAAADAGLAQDSESTTCATVRARALMRLGRKQEADEASRSALRLNPGDAYSHASYGWALLESGLHKEALVEFQEALRIDPEMEWARNGMLTALKARYPVYRWVLSWSFFMRRFGSRGRYAIVVGLWLGVQVVSHVGNAYPALRPWAEALVLLYVAFCYLTWTTGPLFNTLLRFNKFGRMLLSRSQVIASTLFATYVAVAVASAIGFMATRMPALIILAAGSLLLSWFVGVAEQSRPAAFRRLLIALGVVLTLVLAATVIFMLAPI